MPRWRCTTTSYWSGVLACIRFFARVFLAVHCMAKSPSCTRICKVQLCLVVCYHRACLSQAASVADTGRASCRWVYKYIQCQKRTRHRGTLNWDPPKESRVDAGSLSIILLLYTGTCSCRCSRLRKREIGVGRALISLTASKKKEKKKLSSLRWLIEGHIAP